MTYQILSRRANRRIATWHVEAQFSSLQEAVRALNQLITFNPQTRFLLEFNPTESDP